jgi:hypothetical protein
MRKSTVGIWIAALMNSEEFKVTNDPTAPLKINGMYSPLGILCEMHRRFSSTHGEWSGKENKLQVYNGHMQSLPPAVKLWAGLSEKDAQYLSGRSKTTVISWLQGIRNQEALQKRKLFQMELPMLSSFAY